MSKADELERRWEADNGDYMHDIAWDAIAEIRRLTERVEALREMLAAVQYARAIDCGSYMVYECPVCYQETHSTDCGLAALLTPPSPDTEVSRCAQRQRQAV